MMDYGVITIAAVAFALHVVGKYKADPSISVSVGYPGDGTIQVYSPADGYAVTLSIEVFE